MKINYTLFLLAFSMNCYHHSLQAMNNASKNSNIIIIPEVKIELTRDEKVKIVKDVQKYFTPFNIVLNPYEIIDHGVLKLSTKLKKLKLKEKQDLLTHISKFTWLTSLFLRDNNLSSLPNSIRNLNNLTKRYLKKNNFASVPNAIGRLTNLICIDFSYNQLELLPSSIGNLINLEKADFSFNRIRSLPDTIKNLTQLTKLDLTNNKLIFVPSSIGKIGALITLCLTDNPQLLSNGDDPLKWGKNELKDHFVDRVTLDPPSLKAPSLTPKKIISVTPIKNTRNTNAVNVRSISQNTKIVDKPKPVSKKKVTTSKNSKILNKSIAINRTEKKEIFDKVQKKFSYYNITLFSFDIICKNKLHSWYTLRGQDDRTQQKLLSYIILIFNLSISICSHPCFFRVIM